MSAIAGGLRALLRSRGELARSDVMRIYVPVSLHRGDPAQARGNSITEMVVQLPVGVEDPEERLRRTADETAARKARARPVLAGVPHRGLAGRAFLKLIDRQRVNVASADIHGPEVPLYFAGARVVEVFPLGQLLGKNSLSVAAMSYAGSFDMMVLADYDGYPDLDVFADGLRSELLVLASRLRTQDAA